MSNLTHYLKGSELQELYHALLSAFPTVDELEQMVRFELDEQLEHIAAGQDLGDIVFNLITWAEAQGKLEELIQAARNNNPGNLYLKQVAQLICPLPTQSPAQLLASLDPLQLPTQLAVQSPELDMDDQPRRIDAATPAQAIVGTFTEVWVQICMPDSNGFRDELPTFTEYGDEVTQQDVCEDLLRTCFPRNPESGDLEEVSVLLKVRAPDFHIPHPIIQQVLVYPYEDSGKFIFFLKPHRATQRSTILVDIMQETAEGKEATLGTIPLQTTIRAKEPMHTPRLHAEEPRSNQDILPVPWILVALPLLMMSDNAADRAAAASTTTIPQDTAGEQQHVIFMPDAPQPDDFARYEAGLNLLLIRLGSNHPRFAEAQEYAQQLQENIDAARHDSDNEQLHTERDAIIAQLNRLSLQTVGMLFAELCDTMFG